MKDLYTYIINEGGASGHMHHPQDYDEMTLRDIKGLIRNLFSSHIEDITEKIDGTNIQATVNSDDEVRFIRNKTDLNRTDGGMTISEMADKWSSNANIQHIFITAAHIIEQVLTQIDYKFFNPDATTRRYVNCECVIAGKTNIMPYATDQVDFHDIWVYTLINSEWINTDVTKKGLEEINRACSNVEGAQLTPQVIISTTDKSKDILVTYIKEIDSIFKHAHCNERSTIGDYKRAVFDLYVSKHCSWVLDNEQGATLLYNRWFNGDRSTNIRKIQEMYGPDNDVRALETISKRIVSQCVERLDAFFIRLGNDIISLCTGLINSGNESAVIDELTKDLENAVTDIKRSGDDEAVEKLFTQMKRIENMRPNAAEGIVFRYKGKLMKLTGAFGALNQCIGMSMRMK